MTFSMSLTPPPQVGGIHNNWHGPHIFPTWRQQKPVNTACLPPPSLNTYRGGGGVTDNTRIRTIWLTGVRHEIFYQQFNFC